MTTTAFERAEDLIERSYFLDEKTLDLSYLGLTRLPTSIGDLNLLKRLSLRGNRLKTLPRELFRLNQLDSLDLSNNNFIKLSGGLGKLSNLKALYLGENRFRSIPIDIFKLFQLRVLDIAHNQLTEIPRLIGLLSNLRELQLMSNYISELSTTVSLLGNLVKLDLHRNQLENLPVEISNCSSLREIHLGFNSLNILPRELDNLSELEVLDLRDNNLFELPPEFLKLQRLKKLDVRGNDLSIPLEISSKLFTPEVITNFYFQNIKPLNPKAVRPLNELKMLLLGEGTVGKTSLVKYLISNQKSNLEEKTTQGIQRNSWYLPLNHALTGKNHDLKIRIWDFGGQEIQHQTHQFFLTKRSFYLILIDARRGKEESRLEHWLKTVESYAGDAPIIVVVNKIDENPTFEIDKKGLKRKYPSIKDFVFTSCHTGKGIEELKQKIQYHVSGEELKEIFQPFNRKWRAVKDSVERINSDSINFDEYQQICVKKNIKDSLSQTALIDFLHDLGTILYYRQDQHLKAMGVLNPAWVTKGVYRFVTDSQIKEAGGMMTEADLDRLLLDPLYPSHKRPFILEMMKKYELVFSAIGNTHFLVADLLPEEQPKEIEELEKKSLLRFKYRYSFLSSKIISRFIVRTNQKIKNNLYWRRGVVLSDLNNFAIVRADLEEKEIILYVGGTQTTCRDFLSQLREVFQNIHQEIKNLDIEEFVSPIGYPSALIKYQDLITAESVKEIDFFVPELKRRVLITDLLDGFENPQSRSGSQNINPKERNIMTKVFISHSSNDKEFARQITKKLRESGIEVWIDEDEIYAGDSLIQKISQGIANSDCIIYILTPDSVGSNWVKEEFNAMMIDQILMSKNKVIPLLYKSCEIPTLLKDKLYVDFRDSFKYETEFKKLLDSIKRLKNFSEN